MVASARAIGTAFPMADLETLLMQVAQHGKPSIHLLDNGWYCYVDMHVAAAGAKFQVASDFKQSTPLSAAEQCAERIDAMLRGFSANPKAITHA
jgi:hypothetical protein